MIRIPRMRVQHHLQLWVGQWLTRRPLYGQYYTPMNSVLLSQMSLCYVLVVSMKRFTLSILGLILRLSEK